VRRATGQKRFDDPSSIEHESDLKKHTTRQDDRGAEGGPRQSEHRAISLETVDLLAAGAAAGVWHVTSKTSSARRECSSLLSCAHNLVACNAALLSATSACSPARPALCTRTRQSIQLS